MLKSEPRTLNSLPLRKPPQLLHVRHDDLAAVEAEGTGGAEAGEGAAGALARGAGLEGDLRLGDAGGDAGAARGVGHAVRLRELVQGAGDAAEDVLRLPGLVVLRRLAQP